MRGIWILFVGIILIFGCVIPSPPTNETGNGKPGTDFCGWSTNGSCKTDYDCVRGGCSNQVCHSTGETAPITTCEYRECFSTGKYGVECKCSNNKCQWK